MERRTINLEILFLTFKMWNTIHSGHSSHIFYMYLTYNDYFKEQNGSVDFKKKHIKLNIWAKNHEFGWNIKNQMKNDIFEIKYIKFDVVITF